VVLPYSHLRGAAAQRESCILLHSLAIVTILGPPDIIREMAQLVSRQRLAAVRHSPENLAIAVQLEDDLDFTNSKDSSGVSL
jgi:hypothetical protein